MLQMGPEIPAIAERTGVTIVAGPYVNREHLIVAVVGAERPEDLDRFLVETRLHQWNAVRVMPSLSIEEGMKDLQEGEPIF